MNLIMFTLKNLLYLQQKFKLYSKILISMIILKIDTTNWQAAVTISQIGNQGLITQFYLLIKTTTIWVIDNANGIITQIFEVNEQPIKGSAKINLDFGPFKF